MLAFKFPFRLCAMTFFVTLTFFGALIHADQAKPREVISNSLVLSASQSAFLIALFQGAVDEQYGLGNNGVESYSFSRFLEILQARYYSMGSSLSEAMRGLDLSKNSATRQWLKDQGFNPHFAIALEVLLGAKNSDGESLRQVLAKNMSRELGISEAEVLTALPKISFRLPAGASLSPAKGLGSILGYEIGAPIRSQAFDLNDEGKPKSLDPVLQNSILWIQAFRNRVDAIARTQDSQFRQNVRGYLYGSLASSYSQAAETLQSLEQSAYELQGLIDSIKYKLSLPEVDTARESQALNQLLGQALELRSSFVRHIHEHFNPGLNSQLGRWPLFDYVNRTNQQWELLRRKIKAFCSFSIDEMDRILGFDGDVRFQFNKDTPWELTFYRLRAAATAVGLGENWENIRTFEILVGELHRTAHWTTLETRTVTRDGKQVTETYTQHHNSSSDDYSHETIPTPQKEIDFQKQIDALKVRAQGIRKRNEAEQLIADALAVKSSHAQYAIQFPVGKDESTEKLKRVDNQQAQIRELIESLRAFSTLSGQGLVSFNSAVNPSPEFASNLQFLSNLDQLRHRRTTITLSLAGAASAAAGTCVYFLTPGHGGGY